MKLLLKLIASLMVLLILAVGVLLSVIDPNDYKAEIQTQVKKTINRDLLINGDLNWSFYPQLGFTSGEIELKNPSEFNSPNLVKIEHAAIEIAVLPLFTGEINLGQLTIEGLHLNLITNKNGHSNLDNMIPEKTSTETHQVEQKQSKDQNAGFFAIGKAQLAGINIKNVIIEVQNLQTNSTTKVNLDHLYLGKFVAGKETDLSIVSDLLVANMNAHIELKAKLLVDTDLSSLRLNQLNLQTLLTGDTLPNSKISSSINANIIYQIANQTVTLNNLDLLIDRINLTGSLSVQAKNKTKVRFALQGNEWDLTPYLPETEKTAQGSQTNEQQSKTNPPTTSETQPLTAQNQQTNQAKEQEPDLSFLKNLDVNGTFALAGIKVSEITIGKINSTIAIKEGKAQIKPLTAQLYKGRLTLNAWVDENKGSNTYQINSQLKNVQIRPLLIDVADIDLLSGTTAFDFSGSGKGLTVSKVKSALVGKGNFKLLDGELYGVNISQELRILKAKLSGKPRPTNANIKKTDFASLTGDFSIKNGSVDNHKLLMLSPVMRLDGAGLINILTESLAYKLSLTALTKSDANTQLHDLNGITLPLLIKGPFTAPKFSIDSSGALKEQLKIKTQKLKAKLKKQQDNLRNKSPEELKQEGKKLKSKFKKELRRLFD